MCEKQLNGDFQVLKVVCAKIFDLQLIASLLR